LVLHSFHFGEIFEQNNIGILRYI